VITINIDKAKAITHDKRRAASHRDAAHIKNHHESSSWKLTRAAAAVSTGATTAETTLQTYSLPASTLASSRPRLMGLSA
jgi:hypothetical protein